jgi:hypothetical protein
MEEEVIAPPTDSTVQVTSGSEIGAHSGAIPAIPLKNAVVNTESDTVGMEPISDQVRRQTGRDAASISGRRDGSHTGRAGRSECCLLL